MPEIVGRPTWGVVCPHPMQVFERGESKMHGEEYWLTLFYWVTGICFGALLGFALLSAIFKWPFNYKFIIFIGLSLFIWMFFVFYYLLEMSLFVSFIIAFLTTLLSCWAGLRAGDAAEATYKINLERKKRGEFNHKKVSVIMGIVLTLSTTFIVYAGFQVFWISIIVGISFGLFMGLIVYFTYR